MSDLRVAKWAQFDDGKTKTFIEWINHVERRRWHNMPLDRSLYDNFHHSMNAFNHSEIRTFGRRWGKMYLNALNDHAKDIPAIMREEERINNLMKEPDNPKYWAEHGELDFFVNARPSQDNHTIVVHSKYRSCKCGYPAQFKINVKVPDYLIPYHGEFAKAYFCEKCDTWTYFNTI